MKLIITFLIFLLLIVGYFIFSQKETTNISNKSQEAIKDTPLVKTIPKKEIEKPKLMDEFINTNVPKNYSHQEKDSKIAPDLETQLKKGTSDSDINVDVDINKETRELEKLKFNYNKKF